MERSASSEIVVYETPDGKKIRVDERLEEETVWLTQRQMADLFDTSPDNVGSGPRAHCETISSGATRSTTSAFRIMPVSWRRH